MSAILNLNTKQNRALKRAANEVALKKLIRNIIVAAVVIGVIGYCSKVFGMDIKILLATAALQPILYFIGKRFGKNLLNC